ncbi:MAG: hypothetical protein A4E65_02625 [Syntrophorhabdus sp. PtaU1.Bin153]|nr:MAG: hypothetical protein A4E65_02625 [Syntrophorhabdus sp. PtaU1.Bin153]
MSKSRRIGEFVTVAPRFLRSVNLSADWRRSENSSGYIITPNVTQALGRLCQGLLTDNGQRAFTLIGPYGSGKSAFAVFLCQLLGDRTVSPTARKLLAKQDQQLAASFKQLLLPEMSDEKGSKGFLSIAVTARRRPIGQILVEGLLQAAAELEKTRTAGRLSNRIQECLDSEFWKDTRSILELLKDLGQEAKRQHFLGLLVLVDEAGKTLEYALDDHEGGDVYVFQEIAEYANRNNDCSLLFLIALHQMFDDYVELAERTVRAEWTKVQERFQTIQFSESAATTIRMVADAISHSVPLSGATKKAVDEAISELDQCHVPMPVGMTMSSFRDFAARAWPLHPTVLLALPHLFRRLAQNERSVFSYLTSYEPFGFQEHMETEIDEDNGFIRLHNLYAYLLSNFEAGLARLPHAKRLLEANDIISSRQSLSEDEFNLIRTVAMLNVLGEMSPLKATKDLLNCASVRADFETVEKLRLQSIFTYRQLDASYRVWEGSDVDIEARMKEARRQLRVGSLSLLDILRRHLPERRLFARRHSFEKGIQRYFEVEYAERINKPEDYQELGLTDGASGRVLVVLPQSDHIGLLRAAEQATSSQVKLAIALPRQIETLRMVVEEVACLRWVESHTEELRDDRVARRELSLRLTEGEQKIVQLLQALLDPRPAPFGNSCKWFWNGADQAPRHLTDVTKLLSHACDVIFSESPVIRNELVARSVLSSAAAAARRSLLERMLTSQDQERLNIDGFPPERSIYESVLNAGRIHIFDSAKGAWRFQMPGEDDPVNLRPCWKLLDREIFTPDVKRLQVQDLFLRLAEAPYGLPRGIHPILFTAFYIVNQDDLFLYREETYLPEPKPAHFELLQRRPDLFSVSGARLDGIRRDVVSRLAKGLNTSAKTAPVVRSLFRVINGLPSITLASSQFKEKRVVKMRDCFLQARSPEELLFSELPLCFEIEPFLHNETRVDDINRFFDGLNGCLSALGRHAAETQEKVENILLDKCGLSKGVGGWTELEGRAAWLGPRINHEILKPFLSSVVNGISDNHNSKPALSYVANRSFDQWTDLDVDRFPGLADGIGEQFRRAWGNFGDISRELSADESRQKEELCKELEPELRRIRGRMSVSVVTAALREMLRELEQEYRNDKE